MEANAIRLYTLNEKSIKAYLLATLFIAGNILLPQLCHLVNLGGKIMLPIYFFTLVGAYKYGWKVGLLTAIVSPLLNSAFLHIPEQIPKSASCKNTREQTSEKFYNFCNKVPNTRDYLTYPFYRFLEHTTNR